MVLIATHFFCVLDIFQSQMWSDFAASTPNHFQLVAEGVRKTVLHSKADGTVRTYLGGFNRWKRWAVSNGLSVAGESFSRGHVHAMPSGGSQVSVADLVRSVQHRLGAQAVWVLEDLRSSAGGFDAQGVSTTCKPSEEEKRAHHSGDVGSVDLQVER